MASNMPWIPVNMTPERRRKVEEFSRFRRIGRAEAAALLIDAGIEALRPVIREELEERHAGIRRMLLAEPPAVVDDALARHRRDELDRR